MSDDNQALILQLSADIRRLERAFERASGIVNTQSSRMERRARQASDNMSNAFRQGLSGLGPALAAAFSVSKIAEYADAFTRFTNQLKVAGLEGSTLVGVQNRLFDTAQKYGVTLESLGGLYGRVSQGAKELGANSADLIRFAEGVAAALKVQGGSAESSRGAILQLSQALGGAVVRAEEFNSINEGARPILQAVADHIDRFGGSVAKLRAEVILGKVTSQEFFQAFLQGTDDLKVKAEKAALTISASFQILNNALGKYIGEADKSLSATEKVSGAIKLLAENLDLVVTSAGVVVTIFGGALIGRSVTAGIVGFRTLSVQIALFNAQLVATEIRAGLAAGSLGRLTTTGVAAGAAMRGLSGAMAFFGGPIGLAITGVALALGTVALMSSKLDAEAQALTKSITDTSAAIAEEKQVASLLSQEQGKMPAEFSKVETATASLTGEVNKLADAHYRAANAAKIHRLEEARAAADEAVKTADKAREAVNNQNEGDIANAFLEGRPLPRRSPRTMAHIVPQSVANSPAALNARSGSLQKQADLAAQNAAYLADQVKKIEEAPLETFLPKASAAAAKKGKKVADPTARENTAERKSLAQDRRVEDELTRANDDLLRAQSQRAMTAQQALDFELKAIDRDEAAMKTGLDRQLADRQLAEQQTAELLAKKKITAAEAEDLINAAGISKAEHDKLLAAQEAVVSERRANAARDGEEAIRRERMDAEQQYLDLTLELLGLQSNAAKTAAERRQIELEALSITQKMARDQLEEAIKQDQQKGTPTFDYEKARVGLSKVQDAQTAATNDRNMGPLEAWRDESVKTAAEVQEAYEKVAVKGLDGITDSFVGVITGTKDAASAFSDMAKSIIADLARIAVQKYITGPLSDSIFGKTDDKGVRSGGWLSFDGGGFTGYGARSGGMDGKGGFPAMLHPWETVTDHTKGLRNVSPVGGSRGGAMSLTLHSTYQIEGAIGKDEIAGAIRRAHDSAVSSAVDIGRRQLPGSMAKLNKYGTT